MRDTNALRRRYRTSVNAPLHLIGAVALGLAACGGDSNPTGPDGITLDDLAGFWTATIFEFSQAGVGQALPPVDLVAEGFTVTIDIEASGRFTLSTAAPQGGVENDTGTLEFDSEAEDFLLIVFDDEPGDELEFFFVIVSEDSFRLIDNTGEGTFDFDEDGVEEPARINSTWVRS